MPIDLQDGILYGPVSSRRLGRSLGVNPLPTDRKVCSLDCNYCQYGFEKPLSEVGLKDPLPTLEELTRAVQEGFSRLAAARDIPDCITVAGNGEPTMHPKFLEFSRMLRAACDRYFPEAKLGLLSNAVHLNRPAVREAVALYDLPMLKFEWGSPAVFAKMNGVPERLFDRVFEGLKGLRGFIVQALFVEGPEVSNATDSEVEAWIERLAVLKPDSVQVYSLDRPPADERLKAIPEFRLREIASRLTSRTGIPAEVFVRGDD